MSLFGCLPCFATQVGRRAAYNTDSSWERQDDGASISAKLKATSAEDELSRGSPPALPSAEHELRPFFVCSSSSRQTTGTVLVATLPLPPVNAARPAKPARLVKLMSAGFRRTGSLSPDTSAALLEAGFMRVAVPLAGDLDSAEDCDSVIVEHVGDAPAAADLCLRVLSAAQAGRSCPAANVAELRHMAASDFAASAVFALRCGGMESGPLHSLIYAAAQLDYPEVRDALLVSGTLDALAVSLVILVGRMASGRRFPGLTVPAALRASHSSGTALGSFGTTSAIASRIVVRTQVDGAGTHFIGTYFPEPTVAEITPVEGLPLESSSTKLSVKLSVAAASNMARNCEQGTAQRTLPTIDHSRDSQPWKLDHESTEDAAVFTSGSTYSTEREDEIMESRAPAVRLPASCREVNEVRGLVTLVPITCSGEARPLNVRPVVCKLAILKMSRMAGPLRAPLVSLTRSTRRTSAPSGGTGNRKISAGSLYRGASSVMHNLRMATTMFGIAGVFAGHTSGDGGTFGDTRNDDGSTSIVLSAARYEASSSSRSGTATADRRRCSTGRAVVRKAARELRAISRDVGERLLMADLSAIFAYNRRCRPMKENTENMGRTFADMPSLLPNEEGTPATVPPTALVTLSEITLGSVARAALGAIKALSGVGEYINLGNAWAVESSHPTTSCLYRLHSALSAVLCVAHRPRQSFELVSSMRAACLSAFISHQTSPSTKYSGDVDPLLLRLRGHMVLIWEHASLSGGEVTGEDDEATEELLLLMAEYVSTTPQLGRGSVAAASEVLVYARSIFAIGAVGMRPSAWRAQRLRAADAWFGAASHVAGRVSGGSGNCVSAGLLVALLLGRQPTLTWVYKYAEHVLFSGRADTCPGDGTVPAGFEAGISFTSRNMVAIRHRMLTYFTNLVKLVAVALPPQSNRDCSGGDNGKVIICHHLTACNVGWDGDDVAAALLSRLDFILEPTMGFVVRILERSCTYKGRVRNVGIGMKDKYSFAGCTSSSSQVAAQTASDSSQTMQVCTAALLLAEAAFLAPASPFLRSRMSIDTHVHAHFISVLRLYNVTEGHRVHLSEDWVAIVSGHLRVLVAMARAGRTCMMGHRSDCTRTVWNGDCSCLGAATPQSTHVGQICHLPQTSHSSTSSCGDGNDVGMETVARSFDQLRVLDFVVREINLEYEVSQRITRAGKDIDATSLATGLKETEAAKGHTVKLHPMKAVVVPTLHPQIPDMSSLYGTQLTVPALKLGETDLKCKTGTVNGRSGGPVIPKLSLGLGNRTVAVPPRVFPTIPSDNDSDNEGPTWGFIGDLMDDVAHEEAAEAQERLQVEVIGTDGSLDFENRRSMASDEVVRDALPVKRVNTNVTAARGTQLLVNPQTPEICGIQGQLVCEAYNGPSESGWEKDYSGWGRGEGGQRSLIPWNEPCGPRASAVSTTSTSGAVASPRITKVSHRPSILTPTTESTPVLHPLRIPSILTLSRLLSGNHRLQGSPSTTQGPNTNTGLVRELTTKDIGVEKELPALPKLQAANFPDDSLYFSERELRRLYHNERLHVAMLELLLVLLVSWDNNAGRGGDDDDGGLDGNAGIVHSSSVYATQLSMKHHKQNVTLLLRMHLNHSDNAPIVAPLTAAAISLGAGAERLLRLSCDALFRPGRYAARNCFARGAHAQVHRCALPSELGTISYAEVAVKIVDTPQSVHDLTSAVSVYTEIAMLEAMECDPWVAKLLDYGVTGKSFYVVMQRYPASLKLWRTTYGRSLGAKELTKQMPLYLGMYAQCIEAVNALEKYGVVHYDVKADNLLLEPNPGCSLDEFWNPPGDAKEPPFCVVVTDFGESRMFAAGEAVGTLRNRGTEYIKSPEMLTISNASQKDLKGYDRRRCQTCGHPSDVWALGCLLYEILTNTFMQGTGCAALFMFLSGFVLRGVKLVLCIHCEPI